MTQASDFRFCLMWTTEQPYTDRARQSSFFRISGEEFYLRLSLKGREYIPTEYTISVSLQRRNGRPISDRGIVANCITIAGDRAYYPQPKCLFTKTISEFEIFRSYIPKLQVNNTIINSEDWRIICCLQRTGPHSLQIINETIHLSTVEEDNRPTKSIDRGVQVSQEVLQDTDSLSSDISGLLDEEVFPDFQLECGDRVFPVHRSILAARSEVFRAMFRNRMLESETGSTRIEDLEAPVLESLLKFVYSGKLDQVSEDSLPKIYEASDRYAVHSLRRACCHWMKRNLSEENCVSFLDVAESHCDRELKDAVLSIILKHPGVLKSATWLAYSVAHPETAREVLQNYVFTILQ